MTTLAQYLTPFLHHPFYTLLVIWVIVKYKDVKEILSDSDRLSSRRVIAMLAAHNLFRMMNYCVENNQVFDTTMGWTLVILSLICLGLVAIGDIAGLLDKLSSLKSTTVKKETNINKTEEVTVTP